MTEDTPKHLRSIDWDEHGEIQEYETETPSVLQLIWMAIIGFFR